MKVTIKDIARRANISHQAVSMVFAGVPKISQSTRERVLEIAREMQYVPNLAARNLRRGKSDWIGIIINDIANPFYGMMTKIAEEAALERGFQLFISDTQWSSARELASIERMISLQARGVLLCSTEQDAQTLELFKQPGSPAVVAVDTCPRNFTGKLVGNDTYAAGRLAAQHLVDTGCKNPVLFTVKPPFDGFSSFKAMQRGFFQVLTKTQISENSSRIIPAGLTLEEGRQAFLDLPNKDEIDGVFCMNDMCAIGVMAAALESNRKVGRDIAVMGIDDLSISQVPQLSLTSIRQPHEQIARAAVTTLIDSIERKAKSPKRQLFSPELMVRESSRLAG